MSGEDEAATYAEINDVLGKAFQMDVNKCYSNVRSTSSKGKSDGKESSSKRVRYLIIVSTLILVVILVLATTSAGVTLQKIKCITTMMCCFACTLSCKNNHSVVVPTTVDDNDKIWLYIPFYLNQLL